MDLRGLGALFSAIGGYFSAQAGAKAGQLQGLLMGEELTERRKRSKMAEEAHQEEIETRRLQRRLQEAEEARRSELYPLQRGALQQQIEQEAEMFPLRREALATQVEAGKLNLLNNRLWSLYQQGVAPSQISDPVLRQQYEPFFNYVSALNSLNAVMSEEDLQAVLGQLPEEQRRSVEIVGRAKLFENQTRQGLVERQMRGLDINLATGEFQLRTAQVNTALNIVLSNIDREGTNWDKRPTEQKIEAVRKWLRQAGLEEAVPPNFAEMFQKVQSSDARQLALLQTQIKWQLDANLALGRQQFAWNRTLQHEAWMGNIVAGALQAGGQQGGFGGIAPVGFGLPDVPPAPNIFTNTYDNRGSNINQSGLNAYLKPPIDIPVRVSVGNQTASVLLSSLQGQVIATYQKLGRPNASLTAEDINNLVIYDAGLIQASAIKGGLQLDWNTALMMATERIIPILQANPAYQTNNNYQRVLNEWRQAFQQRLQGAQGNTPAPQQGGAQTAPQQARPSRQGGASPSMTQGDIPRGRIGREP